jgi:hypothetical protein
MSTSLKTSDERTEFLQPGIQTSNIFPLGPGSALHSCVRGSPMFRARRVAAIIFPLTLAAFCSALCSAQASPSSTASCYLEDGRQVYIRYNPVSAKAEKPANGKPWAPGGAPMTLFTEAQLAFGSATLPIGAYTVYPIPGKDKWTLVVNKNVAPGAAYDEKQDLARAVMETDQVPDAADTLEVAFAHVGPKCTLRVYFGKSASFADFTAK